MITTFKATTPTGSLMQVFDDDAAPNQDGWPLFCRDKLYWRIVLRGKGADNTFDK
jgi:hypothetical protein